jgi:hypothetical protein
MQEETMRKTSRTKLLLRSAFILLPCALALSVSGCDQIGALGGLVARNIPRHVDAAYKGLAGKSVIVMVEMDRSMRMDYPDLQLDLAGSLQSKLIAIARDQKPDLMKGTTFPVSPKAVVLEQENHPEWATTEDITTTAAKFNGDRLIYVYVDEFATHAGAEELFRGTLKGGIKVIEMKDGKAKLAFHEEDISVLYPKDSPNDGLPIGTESKIAEGTIEAFTDEVAKRFYPHDEDRD